MSTEQTYEVRRLHSFSIIADAVLDDPRVGRAELLVYMALVRHADKEGSCFPSYQRIADVARLSRKTAIVAIDKLVSLGIVQKQERKDPAGDSTSNLYLITDTPSATTIIQPDTRGGVMSTPPWCNHDTRGGVMSTPEVSSSEVSKPKERKTSNSVPVSDSEPKSKKPEATTILDTVITQLVKELNAETHWNINSKSARSTLLPLHDDGLLDGDYFTFVAKQKRVTCAAHWIQSVRSGDYADNWRSAAYENIFEAHEYCGSCFAELSGDECECGKLSIRLNASERRAAYIGLHGEAAWSAKLEEWKQGREERKKAARKKEYLARQAKHDAMSVDDLMHDIPILQWRVPPIFV